MFGYPLPPLVAMALALAAAALCVEAGRRARWQAGAGEHLRWALATAFVLLGQRMVVPLDSGLTLHYLGAAFLALLLGYPRAMLSMAMVHAAGVLPVAAGALDAAAGWAVRMLLGGALPIWTMWLVVSACRRWLPRNPFVFLLGCGLLGMFVAYAVELLASAAVFALLAPELPRGFADDVLPYALLLAVGESWIEGMLTTLLVVYAPGSVRLFDEGYYLGRR